MAFELIGEPIESGSGEIIYRDRRMVRRHELQFTVRGNSVNDRSSHLQEIEGIPDIGDSYSVGGSSDSQALCVSKSSDVLDDSEDYEIITCVFESDADPDSSEESKKPPEERRPQYQWSTEQSEEVYTEDHDPNGPKELVNPVGEEIHATRIKPAAVLRITQFVTAFSPQVILDYVGRTNSVVFWGAQPNTMLCTGFEDTEAELNLREVTAVFKHNADGWVDNLLLEGQKFFPGPLALEAVSTATIAENLGAVIPVNLSADGQLAPAGIRVYKSFFPYPKADFNNIPGLRLRYPL